MQKRKPAWRRACLTYGEMRRVGASDPKRTWQPPLPCEQSTECGNSRKLSKTHVYAADLRASVAPWRSVTQQAKVAA